MLFRVYLPSPPPLPPDNYGIKKDFLELFKKVSLCFVSILKILFYCLTFKFASVFN